MKPLLMALTMIFLFNACSEDPGSSFEQEPDVAEFENQESVKLDPNEEYKFDGPMFDIAAIPNGSILVADANTIKEIHKNGVRKITTLPLVEGENPVGTEATTMIQGLEPIGSGNYFTTRSGLDLAVGAALLRSTRGNTRVVADIEAFTLGDWPNNGDPGQVPYWKDLRCETPGGYSAGPQSNPYHIAALSGSEVLIGDAAGNVLLNAKTNGQIEVVATFDPVVDPNTDEPLVQFELDEDTDCLVEPVPASVAIGPDGAYYVGLLTGATAENFVGEATPEGLASVWRIEAGSRDVVCTSDSDDCTKVISGLNSVIDLEFGPENKLYVVEYEKSGFLSTVAPSFGIPLAGGTIQKCDVNTGECEIIEGENGELSMPGAITFDKWDNLWLLDNVFAPTVRRIELDQ